MIKTSLKDIAVRLNVSKTTVSWTLSGTGSKHGISKETQERIFACAKEMNYLPNLLARSLNTGFSGILGLMIPDITDSFYGSIAREIETEAERLGYTLMICSTLYSVERENRMMAMFRAQQVDGVITAPAFRLQEEFSYSYLKDYPLVTFDQVLPEERISSIVVDNQEATKRIIARMIANGARHISLVSANPQQFTIKERRKGYEQALRAAGLPVDESLIVEVPFETYRQEVFGALDKVFHDNSQVDGFFFTSHIMALEAFRYFYEHGIDINERFQLGCFHGIPAFEAFAPNILVSWMPEEQIGKTAVEIIHEQIECKKKNQKFLPKHVVLNCT